MKNAMKKLARELCAAGKGTVSFEEALNLLHTLGETGARQRVEEWAKSTDVELEALRAKGRN